MLVPHLQAQFQVHCTRCTAITHQEQPNSASALQEVSSVCRGGGGGVLRGCEGRCAAGCRIYGGSIQNRSPAAAHLCIANLPVYIAAAAGETAGVLRRRV